MVRMLVSERQRRIMRLLQDDGSVHVGNVAATFGVSEETVRRDLVRLEEQGLLTRTYGGAFADGPSVETSYQRRMHEHETDKERLALVAATLVRDGTTIIIDSGTTMRAFAQHLINKRDLVVITNGLNHTETLLANPSLTLVVVGGVVRPTTLSSVGELAVATLQNLHADHTFLATHGFSAKAGITYPNFEEIAVKRAMIAAGAEVTLLADGSKCGRTSMVKIAPLTDLNRIITSPPIPETEREEIEEIGVDLIFAGEGEISHGLSGESEGQC
jgi:DeoR/GlpR family transcriptional regulator of sugar metabolism